MGDTGAAKARAGKKAEVTPTAETNRRILKECSTTKVDVDKVMDAFGCSRRNAQVLAAAAENNLVPGGGAKA